MSQSRHTFIHDGFEFTMTISRVGVAASSAASAPQAPHFPETISGAMGLCGCGASTLPRLAPGFYSCGFCWERMTLQDREEAFMQFMRRQGSNEAVWIDATRPLANAEGHRPDNSNEPEGESEPTETMNRKQKAPKARAQKPKPKPKPSLARSLKSRRCPSPKKTPKN